MDPRKIERVTTESLRLVGETEEMLPADHSSSITLTALYLLVEIKPPS